MPAFYRALLPDFLAVSDSELTGFLSIAYASDGFLQQQTDQTLSWAADLARLRQSLTQLLAITSHASQWTVLLEFNIPRKMKRIDVVLLAGDRIILFEQKSHLPTKEDCLQAEEYALLLHYFHQPSNNRRIIPLVVSPSIQTFEPLRQNELPFRETARYWIAPVHRTSWRDLAAHLASIVPHCTDACIDAIDPNQWEAGEYRPVPTIIEAALSLQSGLNIREIAHSRAACHDVETLTSFLQEKVKEARKEKTFVICFISGVPGSGKTLVGLNLAFSKQAEREPIHFMSGNGPLVKVLQVVLARHQMSNGVRALDARLHATTLIENVHVFARTYTDDPLGRAPSNHVIIFDEAQRAWDRAQNNAKFKRDYSEPEMILKIMERHQDWAVIIALVGGGQEINNGEAGLEEWGRSLACTAKKWKVHASPEALEGGTSVAGGKLTSAQSVTPNTKSQAELHLDVPVRSLKADTYARWVNHVVNGEAAAASSLGTGRQFPVLLTRNIDTLRQLLRQNTIGHSRAGLVASSQAARLRAEGVEPDSAFHGNYPWEHWYLAPLTDVRSSSQLEVFATEFEIQGLELDWVGLCWGGDFIWSASSEEWLIRAFRVTNSKWSQVMSPERRKYRRNAYRVLLTRARQGIALYIPRGDILDPTRNPAEFDETAQFLISCGARAIEAIPPTAASFFAATLLGASAK